MERIGLNEVENFITSRKKLRKKLQGDLRSLKIAREADIECCCYYHLRKFLKRDPQWKVFARRHARRTGRYIDILIFHGAKPKIAIELKWSGKHIDMKDRKSLGASLKKLGVKRAYFLTTLAGTDPVYQCMVKKCGEKYRLMEIPVKEKMPEEKLTRWKSEREKLRKFL